MAVRELGDSCQEDLAQPSCEMEGHLCAEEEQAGLGSSFVGLIPDTSDTSVNEVRTRVSRTHHFALDPGLA